jgi:hypothetical protein
MYITDRTEKTTSLFVCFGKMRCDACPNQLITFARCFRQALPPEYRDLLSTTMNQALTFQVPGSIRDSWSLYTQHFGEQVLGNRQFVVISAVTHHKKPTRQSLFKGVGAVACSGHHNLLEKRLHISVHETSKGRHRFHRPCKSRPRHLCCAAGDLNQETGGGTSDAEDSLHARATLTTNRCHLDRAAIRINRQDRYDTAVREEHVVERPVGVHEDLLAVAANLLQLRHKPFEIAGWQRE